MADEPNILSSKVAATPSSSSWAQAYSAGRLFAVISLTRQEDENQDEEKDLLAKSGKDAIETLEQEFFSLENKDLSAIKTAFEISIKKIPQDILVSFVASAIIKDTIYIFHFGETRVSIKRGEEFSTLIDSEEEKAEALSGKLRDQDLIFLQTKQFKEIVPSNILTASIDHQNPSEIAETIAPIIHREKEGGAAAVIIQYKTPPDKAVIIDEEVVELEEKMENETEPEKEVVREEESKQRSNPLSFIPSLLGFLKIPSFGKITHSRKLFLTIAIIIAVVLVSVVFITIKNQNEAKEKALFESIYTPSEEKIKQGDSLSGLNQNLAIDSYEEARKILDEGKGKFEENSEYRKKIADLLTNVENKIEENSPEKIVEREDRSKITLIVENGSGVEGAAGKVADYLKEKGYSISKTQNADNYKYEDITIKIKDSVKIYLNLLKKDLSEDYEVKSTSSDLPSDSSADAVIIVGK